jgi:hypothetical protein
LAFAERHLGRQVGDGQCTALVIPALEGAGARTSLGPSWPPAGPVWGRLVLEELGAPGGGRTVAGGFDAVRPGDVIQFGGAFFVRDTPTFSSWQSYPLHTAVVEASLGDGRFAVLQQNVNGNLTVQRGVIDYAQLVTGTVWVYQPVPRV